MSCTRNQNRIGATACVQNGISVSSGKSAGVMGAMVIRAAATAFAHTHDYVILQMGRTISPLSNSLLGASNRQIKGLTKSTQALSTAYTASHLSIALAGLIPTRFRPKVALPVGVSRYTSKLKAVLPVVVFASKALDYIGSASAISSLATGIIADYAEDTSRASQSRIVFQNYPTLWGDRQPSPITFAKSSLTALLNRGDTLLSSAEVISSDGDIVRYRNQTWHLATTVRWVGDQKRTITHLQRLALPGEHYYFDRPLADEEVAEILAGSRAAESLPGYAGAINRLETLLAVWGQAKKTMILTRLYWPDQMPHGPQRGEVKDELQ